MTEATDPDRRDEPPRSPRSGTPLPQDGELADAVHLLNSPESNFLGLGFRRRTRVATNIALDAGLVVFFTLLSFAVDWGLNLIHLHGVSATVREAITIVFAISTAGSSLLLMVADLLELWKELFRK